MRPTLELADIFRLHGPAFRAAQGNRLLRTHRRVMGAIEACRTATLGGHVEQCDCCGLVRVSFNSCRDRHCPKCQGLARAQWLAARQADLLPVPYFHIVFTVPPPVAAIALQNKAIVYDILLKAAADTIRIIGADPRHLGGQTGMIAILHTWGQTLTHHPHAHCIVPGGALARDGSWIACRPNLFRVIARVLSRLYRRLFLERLQAAFDKRHLVLAGDVARLKETAAFAHLLSTLRRVKWVVYAKSAFGGPQHVLEYLGRYTHRVAIANTRLVACEGGRVSFRWKDYRTGKSKIMTLDAHEFMRRFLLHVLPKGFRRIRHFGFFANTCRTTKLAAIRTALKAPEPRAAVKHDDYRERYEALTGRRIDVCPDCGGTMVLIGLLYTAPASWDTS
jgi:hypothetical protein